MQTRPERIAHRGAPREFDENTVPGFLRALERGADAIELDVHLSADGAVVVHHDPEITRSDGTRVAIATLTLADLGSILLPQGGRVPTLADVMDAVANAATVYVELKGDGVGEAAVGVARRHGGRYAFHSFDHAAVLALRAQHPDLRYGFLFDADYPDAAAAAVAAPVTDIWAHWSLVNASLVAAAHSAGKRVLVWTVDDHAESRRLAALGVDGLCGDDVRVFVSANS